MVVHCIARPEIERSRAVTNDDRGVYMAPRPPSVSRSHNTPPAR